MMRFSHKWRQKFVEIQWYLNHISSSDDNEEVESKRHTSLDMLLILNLFLPDSVNDKSWKMYQKLRNAMNFVEIQWYLNHISSSDDNEEVESKRHTSLDILIILNMFLPDSVNDKSWKVYPKFKKRWEC